MEECHGRLNYRILSAGIMQRAIGRAKCSATYVYRDENNNSRKRGKKMRLSLGDVGEKD